MGGVNRPHAASILKHHSNPGFPGKYSVYSSLNFFRLFIILHLVLYCLGLIYVNPASFSFPPSSRSFHIVSLALWPHHTVLIRYGYPFSLFVPSLLYLIGSCRCLRKGRLLVRRALVRVLKSANCPSCCSRRATRFSPAGSRDVCCGGERGPMWSVALDARCTCGFLPSTSICVVEMGLLIWVVEDNRWMNGPQFCMYVWGKSQYQSDFAVADELRRKLERWDGQLRRHLRIWAAFVKVMKSLQCRIRASVRLSCRKQTPRCPMSYFHVKRAHYRK